MLWLVVAVAVAVGGGGGGGEVGSLMTDSVVTLGNLSGGTTVQHEMV